jgi:hypothetical protein
MKLSLLLTTLFSLLTFNVTALAKEKPTESKPKTIDTAKWYVGAELFNGYGISVGQQWAKKIALEAIIEKSEKFSLFSSCAISDELIHNDLAAVFSSRFFWGGSFNLKTGLYLRSLEEYCSSQKSQVERSVGAQISIGNRWNFERIFIGGDWIGAGLGTKINPEEGNGSTGRFLGPRFTIGIFF